jgi:hypothetical protein
MEVLLKLRALRDYMQDMREGHPKLAVKSRSVVTIAASCRQLGRAMDVRALPASANSDMAE